MRHGILHHKCYGIVMTNYTETSQKIHSETIWINDFPNISISKDIQYGKVPPNYVVSIHLNYTGMDKITIWSTEKDIPQFSSLLGQFGGLAKVFITLLTTYSTEKLRTTFSDIFIYQTQPPHNYSQTMSQIISQKLSYQIAVNKDYLVYIIIGIIIDKFTRIKYIIQLQKSSKCKNFIRFLTVYRISYEYLEKSSKIKHITILDSFVV